MGAYSPAPVIDGRLEDIITTEIVQPTIDGMIEAGTPYVGFMYFGLMIDVQGNPSVLEINVRFGDPECQPILMRLQSDIVELCHAGAIGTLDMCRAVWDPRPALGVVMASGGYPGDYEIGHAISGASGGPERDNLKVFHAGTAFSEHGYLVTSGGRVLCVTALAASITEAQASANSNCSSIHWRDCFFRTDIGHRAIAREAAK
jgi:phosphoribosylamine--glycine ligase